MFWMLRNVLLTTFAVSERRYAVIAHSIRVGTLAFPLPATDTLKILYAVLALLMSRADYFRTYNVDTTHYL
jgi:hypothetical protein